MNQSHLRKILYALYFSILLIAIQQVLSHAIPARADVAPPPPPVGSDLSPGSEITNVRMISETVTIEVAESSTYKNGHAVVTAKFQMRNLGDTVEEMTVRFPLSLSHHYIHLSIDECKYDGYPTIDDISVWVDDRQLDVTKTFKTVPRPYVMEGTPQTITIPCWAHFPVTFPPGQDVSIVVQYTVVGYRSGSSITEYFYVLQTGAGWKDTIGKAQIIVRFPYDITPMNFIRCYPEDCKPAGNEVRWDYEDFEPTEGLISIDIMLPSLWRKILTETERTTANPSDGEAWGRLGKAYKEAIMAGRGFAYYGSVTAEMYQLSQDAYQKAVTLLPNDADWHYGFAELICWRAEWGFYGEDVSIYSNNSTSATIISSWTPCAEQLKLALDINPEHVQANKLLRYIDNLFKLAGIFVKFVDLSGPQPDYLILTPRPTAKNTVIVKTKTPTVTPVKTRSPSLTPSDMPQPEQTKIIPATEVADHMAELQPLETATEEMPSSPPQTTKTPLNVGIILVLVAVALGFIVFRKR